MSEFMLSQLLASATIATECFAVQLKNQRLLLALLSLSCFFNGLHFFLLDQPTAGYILMFSSIRFLISMRWKSQWLAAASLIVSLAIVFYTYIGFLSILGFAGTVIVTIGSFSTNDKILRITMIVDSVIWLVHNALLGSPAGVLLEATFIGSSLIGFYRLYIAPNHRTIQNLSLTS